MEQIKKFSINDIELYQNDDSVDFAIAELEFLSDGDNEQNCPISLETLKEYADTAKGKFIIAEYDKYMGDTKSHTESQQILGYIPPNSEITFRYSEKYEKTFAVCQAVISKLYGTGMDVYKMFTKDNGRSVSTEFSTHIPNPDENDEGEITKFDVRGITILGKSVRPAVEGANMKIMQFSAEKAENYYNSKKENVLKQFAEERKEKLNLVSQTKNTVIKDENNKEKQMSIKKEKTFAVEIGNLWCLIYDVLCAKYPDRDYGSIYRICGIYEENGSKFAIIYRKDEAQQYKLNFEITNSEIIMSDDIVEVETTFVESENIKKFSEDGEDKYKNFVKEDIVMEDKDKKKIPNSKEEKEMEEKETKKLSDDDIEEEDDDNDDGEKKMKKMKDKKKFSLDSYVDSTVTLAMLEKETEDNKKLADKVMKEMSADEIVSTILSFAKENEDLKKYKDEKQKDEKEKKLSSIMASVKEDLDEKQFSELQDEGKTLTFSQLDAFTNKVKAFAYEATKGKTKKLNNEDGIMRFASNSNFEKEVSYNDVFERIANK